MSLPPLDLDLLKQWVGRSETREDLIHVAAVNAMAATLDKEQILSAVTHCHCFGIGYFSGRSVRLRVLVLMVILSGVVFYRQ